MDTLLGIYVEHPFWVWAALGALFLAIEAGTGSGWLLWPAASAVIVGVIALLFPHLSAPLEALIFAAIVIVATLLSKRYLPKSVMGGGGDDINDNVARLVEREGVAVAGFARGRGRVNIDGKEWSALLDGDAAVREGDKVIVTRVDGVELRVRPAL